MYYTADSKRPVTRPQAAVNKLLCLKSASTQEAASSSSEDTSWLTVFARRSKVLLLRSFQIIHEVRITKESKHLRSALANLLRDVVHQSARSRLRPSGVSACQCMRRRTKNQHSFAKGQFSNKCVIDSDC